MAEAIPVAAARRLGRTVPAVALAVVALAAAGCRDGEATQLTQAQLERLVLLPSDLPRTYQLFDEGRQVPRDAQPLRADPDRFGRQDGWKARYKSTADPRAKGPLTVESRVDSFGDEKGAREDLDAYAKGFGAASPAYRRLTDPELGDGARAYSLVQGTSPDALRRHRCVARRPPHRLGHRLRFREWVRGGGRRSAGPEAAGAAREIRLISDAI